LNEATFDILEKNEVSVMIINKTLVVSNKGNIPYNKSIVVKIGNETRIIEAILGIDDLQKFVLTAPDGEYDIEVVADGETYAQRVMPIADRFTVYSFKQ
jgi:uncharacterized protein with ACT and thioredoxin-like domain